MLGHHRRWPALVVELGSSPPHHLLAKEKEEKTTLSELDPL